MKEVKALYTTWRNHFGQTKFWKEDAQQLEWASRKQCTERLDCMESIRSVMQAVRKATGELTTNAKEML